MKILHALWIPQPTQQFLQTGDLYLWLETSDTLKKAKRFQQELLHPQHLPKNELMTFLKEEVGLTDIKDAYCATQAMLLPTKNQIPLPSLEMSRCLSASSFTETAEEVTLQPWHLDCYRIENVIRSLSDIHFLVLYNATGIQLGTDFLFWYHCTRWLKQLIYKDQYIPALLYRQIAATAGKTKKRQPAEIELYTAWQLVSEQYETYLQQAISMMPLACVASVPSDADQDQATTWFDKMTLLRHFSEVVLNRVVKHTSLPATFTNKFRDTLVHDCYRLADQEQPWGTGKTDLTRYQQWQTWQQKIVGTQQQASFYLGFQLQEAQTLEEEWCLHLLVIAKSDLSLKVLLQDYWKMATKAKKLFWTTFGKDFEQHLLSGLGYAARMYPKLREGLKTSEPVSLTLNIEEAFAFLKESAWVLEDAGYKIIIPAWWTPEGRRHAKIRLRSAGKRATVAGANKTYFTLPSLLEYNYELAIDGQPVTAQEWQQLVNAKLPLVQFRGQWMQIDRDQMQQLLDFWQTHRQETTALSVHELLRKSTEESDTFEIEPTDMLAEMLTKLRDHSHLPPIADPPHLRATLRDYQKRGVAWLQYLEQVGLHGCLADDMGLGKTMQVIAHLCVEQATRKQLAPTLLIAPTSVLGNWQKEMERFAPHLKVFVHHGNKREQDEAQFQATSLQHNMVITSFALARKDAKLFNQVQWRRIVVDEAQNIKNPKAEQTKTILRFTAPYRLALTGTPVENRLMDLWSIFNFLNPGYLGKQTHFRNTFELPIQRDNDPVKSSTLKQLIQPFILRRVKTDKNIIKDLPDKVEHKQYCNLTQEQATLYEAVVKAVVKQLQDAEGIARQGLMLSTLMRLKQICNHPAQFLQDGSDFLPDRSHKLQRFSEMLEEVVAEGESALVFTQFTEIGSNLQKYLKQQRYLTYYLHGGTSRQQRDSMMAEFQHPETAPSVFILSLKAGGVGITLTKANHVFHFDRWWNPAVEDQATDRAFRIGQEKKVFVHKFVTLGTLEERIDQMIEDKKQVANSIVGNDESWLAKLSNDRFKELIQLNKQTIM